MSSVSTNWHQKSGQSIHQQPIHRPRRRLYPRILFGEPTADSPCTEEDPDLKDDFPCHGAMVFHGDIMQDGAIPSYVCSFLSPFLFFFVSIIGYGISWKLSWTYHEHIRWAIFFTNLRIINQSDLLELFARTNLFIVWGPHIVGIS